MPRSVTDAQKAAWLKDTSHKEMKLIIKSADYSKDEYVITNEFIEKESFSMKQAIMDDELELVGCISTYVSVTVHDVELDSERLYGRLLFIDVNADNTGWLRIFNGNIDSITKGSNRTIRIIEAYDAFKAGLNVDVTDWYNNHQPTTLRQLLIELCERSGWVYDGRINNLPNGDMIVPCGSIHKVAAITQTELFKEICQIAGCFGYITGDNKFNIYVPSQMDSFNTARIQNRYYTKLDYETYKTAEINTVICKNDDSDPGSYINQSVACKIIWGDDRAPITFQDAAEYDLYFAEHLKSYDKLGIGWYGRLATSDERIVYNINGPLDGPNGPILEPIGVEWDYPIENAIMKVINATGIQFTRNTEATRYVVNFLKDILMNQRGWQNRIGGIVVMPEETWIAPAMFVDMCLDTLQSIGLYSGTSGCIKAPTYNAPTTPEELIEMAKHCPYLIQEVGPTMSTLAVYYNTTQFFSKPASDAWVFYMEDSDNQISPYFVAKDYDACCVMSYATLNNGSWGQIHNNVCLCTSEEVGGDNKTYYTASTGWFSDFTETNMTKLKSMSEFFTESKNPQIIIEKETYSGNGSSGLYPIEQIGHTFREYCEMIDEITGHGFEGGTLGTIDKKCLSGEYIIGHWHDLFPKLDPDDKCVIISMNDRRNVNTGAFDFGFYNLHLFKIPSNAKYASFTFNAYWNIADGSYPVLHTEGYRINYVLYYDESKTLIDFSEIGYGLECLVSPPYAYDFTYNRTGYSYQSSGDTTFNIRCFASTFLRKTLDGKGIEKETGISKFPTKQVHDTYTLYGNDWNRYMYFLQIEQMVSISGLKKGSTVTTMGTSKEKFFEYFRNWASGMITRDDWRERFLSSFDAFVKERGTDIPEGLIEGNYSNGLISVTLGFVPAYELKKGINIWPATDTSMMVSCSQAFDWIKVDIDMNGYSVSSGVAEYNSYWRSYIAFNQGISRAIKVDNYAMTPARAGVNLLKLGKGTYQKEVWQGSIVDDPVNAYVVQGNIFWYDATNPVTMLYNLFNEIVYLSDLSYRPFEASNPYMPWVEPGDQLIYNDIYDGDMTFRVFTKTVRGIQSMVEVNSAEGDKYQAVFTTSLGVEFVDTTQSQIDTAQTTANKAESDASDAIQRIITIEGQMPVEMTYTQTMSILEEE